MSNPALCCNLNIININTNDACENLHCYVDTHTGLTVGLQSINDSIILPIYPLSPYHIFWHCYCLSKSEVCDKQLI